jgi:hypothetical protein
VNRTLDGSGRDTGTALTRTRTRRQMIAWGAITLGGLAMASTVTLVNASAESNPDGGKIDAQISQRDIDALSKSSIPISPQSAKTATRARQHQSGSPSRRTI